MHDFATRAFDFDTVIEVGIPVTWLRFTGEALDGMLLLNRVTGSESNNDHFNIERSPDALHFRIVGHVAASNRVNGDFYSITDDIKFVGLQRVFHRIVQVDKDLQFSYSDVIELRTRQPVRFSDLPIR